MSMILVFLKVHVDDSGDMHKKTSSFDYTPYIREKLASSKLLFKICIGHKLSILLDNYFKIRHGCEINGVAS